MKTETSTERLNTCIENYVKDDKESKADFAAKIWDIVKEVETDMEDAKCEEENAKYEIEEVRDELNDKERDLNELEAEKSTLEDTVENAIIPTNMNEEDKLEIIKRLYNNCTLDELIRLESIAVEICRNYNIHVSW